MKTNGGPASRRTFLKVVGASAAMAASGPIILRADDAPSTKVIGDGAYKYEALHGWAKLPAERKLGNCHMVQEDAQGRIIVHHQTDPKQGLDSIYIFDGDGKFIKGWGKEWAGGAHGMQLRKEGNDEFLYLATTGQGQIVKTTPDGQQVFAFGYPKDAKGPKGEVCYPDGKGFVPTNIAFSPNGDFYVADGYGKSYVHQYDIKGNYVRTFGGRGDKDGELNCPHGILLDNRDGQPKIIVADRSNERLQWFALDGKHLKTLKPEGNAFRHPCHFDIRGTDLLLPGLHGRVSILDKDNKQVAILGDNSDPKTRGNNGATPEQRVAGVFCTPHGACFDRAGNIFVAEWVRDGRIIKLRHVA